MDFELDTEQTMLVDTVRQFVETELFPHEDLVERLDACLLYTSPSPRD